MDVCNEEEDEEAFFMQLCFDDEDNDEIVNAMLFNSSSDEEASTRDKAPNKKRDFAAAYTRVVAHYFNGRESVYNEVDFERRFRCPRPVFNRIHDALMNKEPFIHKEDATKKLGIHPLVKLVGCFRFIAYGDSYDRDDENLSIAGSIMRGYTKQFSSLIVQHFGKQYLNRPPTLEERNNIAAVMKSKGFPGCLGSWDCKHFNWKNCPIRLVGQHQGHSEGGKKSLILEAVADHRKYIWCANFGDAGSLNDLNVLDKSGIVGSMLQGKLDLRVAPYYINDNSRDWMYFLVDGIYPDWAIFVTTYSKSKDAKKNAFAREQERVRKDIECAFGILVQRFMVLKQPLRGWYSDEIAVLLNACIILHNMITDYREGTVGGVDSEFDVQVQEEAATVGFPLFGRQQVTEEELPHEGIDLFSA